MRLKRMLATAGAVAPLFLGAASPAHGCLVLPENEGTQNAAEHEAFTCGPVGCGPNAPMDGLETAAVEPEESGMFVVPVGQ